jgi:hypothetical protein
MDQVKDKPTVHIATRPEDVRPDLQDKGALQVRQYMSSLGWASDDRLTTLGWGRDDQGNPVFGYSIWFERWNWHGVRCDKRVCGSFVRSACPDQIDQAVRFAAETALRMWETFVDLLPGTANIYGVIEPDIDDIQKIWRSTENFDILIGGDGNHGDKW